MKKRIVLFGLTFAFIQLIAYAETKLETVAKLDTRPANVTVSPDGDVFVTLFPAFKPEPHLIKIAKDGKISTYPNDEWSKGTGKEQYYLDSPLGLKADKNGLLWILDSGQRSGLTQKIVVWDTKKNALNRIIHLPEPVLAKDSFINDLVVDLDHQAVYITDSGVKCLLVIDLKTGNARHVLKGHASVMEEKEDLVIDGNTARKKNPDGSIEKLYLPVNPITGDVKNEFIYYGPLSGKSLYRIESKYLRDFSLNDDELAKHVERYSDKPFCDGIGIDTAGNIYISDVANNAIGVITADRKYKVLVKDDKILRWPDSFSYGPDGYIYTLEHQIHLSPMMSAGEDHSVPPYYVVKFKGLAPGVIGR